MNESTPEPVGDELLPLTRQLMDRIAPPAAVTSVPGVPARADVVRAFDATLRRYGLVPDRYGLEYDASPLQDQRARWEAALDRAQAYERGRAARTVSWQRVRGGRATHAFAPGAEVPLCGVRPVRGPGDTPSVWREPPNLSGSGYRFRAPLGPVDGRVLHPHGWCREIAKRDGWYMR